MTWTDSPLAPKVQAAFSSAAEGHVDKAITAYQDVIASRDPVVAPVASLLLGELLEKVGDLVSADAALIPALDATDADLVGHACIDLGRIRQALRDSKGAEQVYQVAVCLGHPVHSPRAAANLGTMYEDSGRMPEAISAYEQAIGFGPNCHSARAAANLGQMFRDRGDSLLAAKMFRFAIESGDDEQAPRGMYQLGYLYQDAGDHEEATRYFEAAIATGNSSFGPAAATALGAICQLRGEHRQAAQRFAEGTAHRDLRQAGLARLLLADELIALGDHEAARSVLDGLIAAGPDDLTLEAKSRKRLLR